MYGTADTSGNYYTLTAGQVQFNSSFAGVKQIWAYATASATNNSGWRQVGTYTVASPLQVDSVQPNSGTGQQQLFQVTVTDRSFVDNFIDLQTLDFLLNSTNSLAGGCWVHVVMNGSTMYLGSDSGVGYAGSEPIGDSYVSLPQNSQCTVNTTNSSVTYSSTDQYTLTFDIALSFKAAFAGARNIYVGIANPAWSIPLTPVGTWTVAAAPAVLQAVSASPSSGMGLDASPTFVYSDTYGSGDLTTVEVLYGTSTNTAGSCWIRVDTVASTLSLANDAGTAWSAAIPMSSVSILQNSQCEILGGWLKAPQGNTYTLTFHVDFQPAFGGLKSVYGMANGTGGATSGWQLLGTWNTANPVPSNVSVSPNSGTGTGGTFTFTFSDTGGVGDLTYLAILFGTPSDPYNWGSNQPSSCFITYNLSPPNFILQDDSGQNTLGGAPGSAGTLANSQCSLDLSHSTVAAGTNLVVTLAISFLPIYQGPLGIWMQAVDVSGLTAMQQMGSWTAASTPSALTVVAAPSPSIFGQPVTLTATVSPTAATGRVTFYDGASILGGAAVASGTAALTTLLPAGARSLRAYYSGDTTYSFSSATTAETVKANAGTGFVAGTPLAAGTEPVAIAVADVNGDGRADLIVVNSGSNNVSVLLGNGSGGFSAAPGSPFTVGFSSTSYGLQPVAVAVGDFNGDGLPDLAVACRGNSSIWLLFGNGSGGFTPAQYPFAAGIVPDAIVAGDFNGDGKADLAIANQNDSTVSVFFGDGAGGFAQAPNSPIDVFSGPAALAVGDFNGDGNADLAVADSTGNILALLFGSPHGVLTISHTTFPASNPTAIAIGDFNGDGKTDLAYTNAGSNNVTVLLGDGGGFNASAGSPFAVGSQPSSLAVGDFNGDGNADLAVANKSDGTISVLLGDGMGGFSPMNGSPFGGGSAPAGVVTGDFNGDGRAGLVTAASGGNNVAVLLATPLISPASLPAGTINAAYPATTLSVTGASGAYTWSATGLPAGLSIDPNSATISGTPTAANGSPFSVQVTAAGNNLTLNRVYSLTIFNHCDLSQDLQTSVSDVQMVVNEALGAVPPVHDLNQDNMVNVVDVQILINSAMGWGCAAH